ncbi:MAG: hypothetical protein KF894_04975 [Labilithrix sp.]|nr:hypothetical protein [Labilithrix sp.]
MRRPALALALAASLAGCGYRAVHGGAAAERFTVVLASSSVPDAVASDDVVAGVRDELARSGALARGEGYPRCEVEVLRADEASEGIAATANADGVALPDARATRVGVVARAWIVRAKDGPRERDTGDVRAVETVAVAPDARGATFRHTDALRAASRRVGRKMGTRLLGVPSSSD